MAGSGRVGGSCYLKVNGTQYEAKGEFSYHPGTPKVTEVVGSGGLHGFTEEDQAPYIEGAITVTADVDIKAFNTAKDATVTLELKSGKTVVLGKASSVGDGVVKTKEGEMAVKFVGLTCDVN